MGLALAESLASGISARFREELHCEGGASALFLLDEIAHALASASNLEAELQQQYPRACELYERVWERLHCGSWKGIHRVWREAFGLAAVLKAQCLAGKFDYPASLKALDMCLMMAGPNAPPQVHDMIADVELKLERHSLATDSSGKADRPQVSHVKKKRRRMASCDIVALELQCLPVPQHPITRVNMPSLDAFHRLFMSTNTPVIITGAMNSWPALGHQDPQRAWRNLAYLRRVAGHRTVPVEVGSSYLEDDWGQQLMTLNEFINGFLSPNATQVGYLAQHHLFEQIPALGRDILTPDYCTLQRFRGDSADTVADEDLAVNAWFGPTGTVSPLHFDPKDNLLCQVVGAKHLRLFAPSESAKLYPVDGLLSNTSQVDVENPDLTAFPRFTDAEYVDCVLREGEMLYIPPTYWHWVKSLSTSFSVSFWWS